MHNRTTEVHGCSVIINVINANHGYIETLAYATTNTKFHQGKQNKHIALPSTEYGWTVLFTPDNKWLGLCLPL